MTGGQEQYPSDPEIQEAPVVLWHQIASAELYDELEADTRYAALALHRAYEISIASTIKAAAYAAQLRIHPNPVLARNFGPEQPTSGRWVAYTCPTETDTDALTHFNYGIWLGVYGDHAIARQFDRAVAHLLGRISTVDDGILPRATDQGRLVFPDVLNGVWPGAYWLPDPARLDVPAWPCMPPPPEAAIEHKE